MDYLGNQSSGYKEKPLHNKVCPLCRMLAKQVQTELAQANSVADEVLGTMTTVRAHAAADSAKAAYAVKLAKFYILQVSSRSSNRFSCTQYVVYILQFADNSMLPC